MSRSLELNYEMLRKLPRLIKALMYKRTQIGKHQKTKRMKYQNNDIMHTNQQNQTTNGWVTTHTNLIDFNNPLNDY